MVTLETMTVSFMTNFTKIQTNILSILALGVSNTLAVFFRCMKASNREFKYFDPSETTTHTHYSL